MCRVGGQRTAAATPIQPARGGYLCHWAKRGAALRASPPTAARPDFPAMLASWRRYGEGIVLATSAAEGGAQHLFHNTAADSLELEEDGTRAIAADSVNNWCGHIMSFACKALPRYLELKVMFHWVSVSP